MLLLDAIFFHLHYRGITRTSRIDHFVGLAISSMYVMHFAYSLEHTFPYLPHPIP